MDYTGFKCARCPYVIPLSGDTMGLWHYADYPECAVLQISCPACQGAFNYHLGDQWEDHTQHLQQNGIGIIAVAEAPASIIADYRAVFGCDPLHKSDLKEIAFGHWLIEHEAADIALRGWETQYG